MPEGEKKMANPLIPTIKIVLILAVLMLAVIASLYVLDVFTTEAARQIATKAMTVLGIWTAASLVVLIVAYVGRPTPPPSKPAP